MSELEALQDAKQEDVSAGPADLLIAIPAALGSEALSSTIAKLTQATGMLASPLQVVLALPGDGMPATADSSLPLPLPPNEDGTMPASARSLRYAHYAPPAVDPGEIPWLPNAAAYRSISAMAVKLGVRACTILGTDLAFNREYLTAEKLTLLLDPALEGSFDLVMPLYNTQPFDELVNKSILYPLTSALYGLRVRNPLGNEFQMSSKLFSSISTHMPADSARQQGRLPWPATIAASLNLKICQVQLGTRKSASAEGIELSDALAQLVGPLFLDMEDHAALWQRIRGSHEVPAFGASEAPTEMSSPVDIHPMLDAFHLGVDNLREIWSLILPPLTLLELKKLSHLSPEKFHMEDALWARIVYDFALAHRLRNIRRAHLFGAFTPLYLGWVASYAVAINQSGAASALERVEQVARTYETEKPYLLSRWRWPDRFRR